jgi:NTE family protein
MGDKQEIQPKIGLALGSGGARGIAHIGVLSVLEHHHIPIHAISGSSFGALVGSLYCIGQTIEDMRKFVTYFPPKFWLDYTVPKMGFVAGDKVLELIRALSKRMNIEEANIPLSIVATNLQKGTRRTFTQGPIAEAVRASISVPGIFVPAKLDGEYYVDGGVIDRVPVEALQDREVDLIIAVDVSWYDTPQPIYTIFDVIAQTIDVMEREIVKYRVLKADMVIRPKVGHYSTNHFSKVDDIILAGEVAARQELDYIKQMIEQWREKQHDGQ